MNKITRGFTMIEVLIVIAIIGVLAAIVLAALGSARNKSKDAKIQEQLNSIRSAAETYYSVNSNYGASADPAETDCTQYGMALDNTSGFDHLMASSSWPENIMPVCANNSDDTTDSTAFAAWHVLGDGTTYWCVDSSGVAKVEASAPAPGSTVCP